MLDAESALVKIVDIPRISITGLLDLRAFLDSGLAFHSGEQIPDGGFDGESLDQRTEGFVRRDAAAPEAWSGGPSEGAQEPAIAPDGGDGNDGRPAGSGR
jgi:hypothetical protein